MRVAVTGATGRLGRALVEALEDAPFTGPKGPIAWSRADLDLDTLTAKRVRALVDRDRPELVIHAAAWTDVDGCAREPDLATRRNGVAAGLVAEACAAAGIDMALVSTNEVFDGERSDGRGYAPRDKVNPINPYGASKVSGEILAEAAAGPRLAVIRTTWLHGPPGNDFPEKIARAAIRARDAGQTLRVVADEVGSPTWTPDLADAIVELIAEDALIDPGGDGPAIHHLVNAGRASRADWAREVLRATGIEVAVADVPASTWQRASSPPLWAVLAPTPLPSGEPMRDWRVAFAHAVPALVRALHGG